MNINAHRSWITPLVIGSFTLSAVTGTLMFFHLDTGLNKLAHEWLSWVLLAAVMLHVLFNLPAFKRYFGQTTARRLIIAAFVVLGLSFISVGNKKPDPPFAGPMRALAAAPLPVLAQVAGVSLPELKQRLSEAGIQATQDTQSVQDLVGSDLRAELNTLRHVLPAANAPRPAGNNPQ